MHDGISPRMYVDASRGGCNRVYNAIDAQVRSMFEVQCAQAEKKLRSRLCGLREVYAP